MRIVRFILLTLFLEKFLHQAYVFSIENESPKDGEICIEAFIFGQEYSTLISADRMGWWRALWALSSSKSKIDIMEKG